MEEAQPTWAHPRSGVSSPASGSHAALPDVDYGALAATQAAAFGMGTASANGTARAQLQGRSSRSSTAASAAPSSGAATGAGHGGSSAAGPSTNQTTVSPHDSEASPPPSGSSTPSRSHSGRPQVLETHHLQLQTHTSGRRMINQYIIEDELGRGVHGKVRLARDTDTGERVAVKIVEREGRKRLGGGNAAWNSRTSALAKGKSRDRPLTGSSIISAASEGASGLVAHDADDGASHGDGAAATRQHHAHFAPVPPRSSGSTSSAYALALSARHGRWGDGGPSRPTAADKELEREREKARERARKQQLWTTDKKVKREIALMKKCAHENVVRLKEVIDDPQSKKIFMVLEYMSGGEVQWKDERGFPTLTIAEARSTLRDVVLGLEYLHYQGIIHRDIKPANLLWDENRRVKISDFGVSHFSYALLVASGGLPSLDGDEERTRDPSLVDDHELAKTAGSPAFFAPELCLAGEAAPTASSDVRSIGRMRATPRMSTAEGSREFPWAEGDNSRGGTPSQEHGQAARKQKPRITKAIDVWALGVTLYCLLFGHPPFTADNEFALFAVIPHEDYELPAFAGADRMRIGPRAKRWRTLPQWTDEEGDVHNEPDASEQDVGPAALSEDMRLLRELLDRLLEKDPEKRIKLEEVKKHPWLTRDLEDAPAWLSQTDPTQHPFVEVTHEEVEDALTGFSKIKLRIKRWQSKLLETLAGSRSRERSKSASHAHPPLLMLSGSVRANGAVSHGASTPAARDMGDHHASSISQPTSAHGKSPGHSHRPGFFFRRQSTAAERAPSAVSELTALSSLDSTRGRRARKYAGTRSQPASRPASPDGSGVAKQASSHGSTTPDAEALLRNLSAASSQGQNASLGSSARKMRPPVIQRRSTSRSTKTIEAARQMMPVFHRSSSESQTSDAAGHGFKLQTAPDGSLLVQPTASTRSSSKSARSSPLMSAGSGASVLMWPSRRASANPGSESPRFSYDLLRAPTNDTVTAQPVSQSPPRQLGQRQTSRSRIGDIFRSVWHPSHGHTTPTKSSSEWQRDGLSRRSSRSSRSRPPSAQPRAAPPSAFRAPDSVTPSTASQKSSLADSAHAAPFPSSGLTVDALGAAVRVGPYGDADVPYSAPLPPRSLAAEEHRQRIVCSPSRPTSPVRVASTTSARRVDVDDVDVDLELSDDDDELGPDGRARGSYLRNDGRGWVMHSGDGAAASIGSSSLGVSAPASEAHSGSSGPTASVTSFVTPSVEGGYNLFKPPYTGGRGSAAHGSTITPLPIEPLHGDSALFSDLGPDHLKHVLAHRRGSSFGHELDAAAPPPAFNADRAAHEEHASSGEADEGGMYSSTDDDRFADADESDIAASGVLDDAEEDDDGDDDGGGFSFEAGRHGR